MDFSFGDGMLFSLNKGLLSVPLELEYIRLYQIGENIMERGGEISEHIQQCCEISYISSGEADFIVDGKAQHVKQGDIHLVSRGCRHKIHVCNSDRLRYAFFGFDIIPSASSPASKALNRFYTETKAAVLRDNGIIFTFLSHFVNELYFKSSYSNDAYGAYAKLILINVYRLYHNTAFIPLPGTDDVGLQGGTVFNIVKYIDANIISVTRVADIARSLNYSASYISRLFRNKMNTTISEYISRKKIEAAIELIKSQRLSLSEVAFYLHFDSYNSFYKAFKRIAGVSPSEYAEKLKPTAKS